VQLPWETKAAAIVVATVVVTHAKEHALVQAKTVVVAVLQKVQSVLVVTAVRIIV